ncbi:MAG: phosphoethanolamine transferase [Phascolarctobacterium sp.]
MKKISSLIVAVILLLCPVIFQLTMVDNQSFRWAHYRWYLFIAILLFVVMNRFKCSKKLLLNFTVLYAVAGFSVPVLFKYIKGNGLNGEFCWDEASFALGLLSIIYTLVLSVRQLGYKFTGFLAAIEFAFILPYCVNLAYAGMAHDLIDVNAFIALYQTNIKEVGEFLLSSAPMYVYVALVAILCVLYAFLYYTLHDVEAVPATDEMKKLLAVGLAFFGICFFTNKTIGSAYFVRMKEESSEYLQAVQKYNAYRVDPNGTLKSIEAKATSKDANETFLVVIGESQNRKHMSTYGYERKTTPWLDEMAKDEHFVIMDNAYACHTLTMLALSQSLTEKSQYNKKPLEKSYSLIDIAHSAGYKTYWISNQAQYGAYNTPVTAIVNFVDESIWLNSDSSASSADDSSVLEALTRIPQGGKKIVFIHLFGNHWAYKHRYPAAKFNRFTEQVYPEKVKSIQTVNEYDNSMLYNDYVMQQIYAYAKDKWQVKSMFYFADHGEAVKSGNSHIPGNYELDMATIPAYIYFADEYITNNKEKYARIMSRKGVPFTNDMVFHMLLDIWGIETPYYNPQENCFDSAYGYKLEDLRCLDDKKVR